MNRPWLAVGVLVLAVGLVSARLWPASADPGQEAQGGDRLAKLEKQLERLDKRLGDMQKTLLLLQKQLQAPKVGWQKIGDPSDTKGEYIWMMHSDTGKIRAIHPKSGNVYDK